MLSKGLAGLTSKPQTPMHVYAALHMCIGPGRDGLPGAAFPSTTCGVITPHVKKSSPRFGQTSATPRQEATPTGPVQVRQRRLLTRTCVSFMHYPVQPRALSIVPTLPAPLHHSCPPCARRCELQQAAAELIVASDHFGVACSFFAGATAATAAYVRAMPNQTATHLPHRHALSAPVCTMHTARATLRCHPRRTSGL